MSKIQEMIARKGLKPSDCLYHTWRDVKGKNGGEGKIRVLVPKSDGIARVEYACPECGNQGFVEAEWKRPFAIRCEKCDVRLTVPKLKDQFKREQKQANARKK